MDGQNPDFCFIPKDRRCPKSADFCICIHGDCMAPYIENSTVVYISRKSKISEFDVGLFLYEGEILCRQWCEDYSGTVHLLCANPSRQEDNIAVPREKLDKLRCLGRVMLGKKLPRPTYL